MNPLEGNFPFTRALPVLGTREGAMLDFKATVKVTEKGKLADPFEAAKDVAAFANTYGGTFLIGAARTGDTLARYVPLAQADSAKVQHLYEEAVRDRCHPTPAIAFEEFEKDGGVVLAVHAAPFPSVVAVWITGDARDGYGDRAWLFFSRIASHCKAFTPEVLPMLMMPEIRRTAILLRSIAPDDPISLRHDPQSRNSVPVRLVEIRELENAVHFKADQKGAPIVVPLDGITTVFKSADGRWHVNATDIR